MPTVEGKYGFLTGKVLSRLFCFTYFLWSGIETYINSTSLSKPIGELDGCFAGGYTHCSV